MEVIIPHINNGEKLNVITQTLSVENLNVVFLEANGKRFGVKLNVLIEDLDIQNKLISALQEKYGVEKK